MDRGLRLSDDVPRNLHHRKRQQRHRVEQPALRLADSPGPARGQRSRPGAPDAGGRDDPAYRPADHADLLLHPGLSEGSSGQGVAPDRDRQSPLQVRLDLGLISSSAVESDRPAMLKFVSLRFAQGIVVLLAIYAITFFLVAATPGSPFSTERAIRPEILAQ